MPRGSRPDRALARKLESEHSHKQVHFHQLTFLEYGTITGGTFVAGLKREQKEQGERSSGMIKRLLPSKDLEEIWRLIMDRLNEKKHKIQAIGSRIIGQVLSGCEF
ncbi:5145_t:CDS:2 [Ambispora gerdemannii]|uniref:5145_t:CDS:1 n=1 Tax=Ambispora gerdemannii TaxID=144530 RepID=A0A9N9FBC9_9GLOM|nr:5145_t:CDS:2 [Ambispora gerdemannii]